MISVKIFSSALVLLGAFFLLASVVTSTRVYRMVPVALRGRWLILTGLICFFLVGYVAFIVLQLTDLPFPLELLVGSVFMGGAFFVFLIINLSKYSIDKLRDANDNLERLVAERTVDLVQSNYDLHDEMAERKKVETRLQEAKSAAEAANLAKSAFLANMSHEIRTPMNAILGFTEILLKNDNHEQCREYLQLVHNSADRLLDIINDILDFSKIEANRIELENIPFDLETLVQNCAKMLAVKAQEKGLEMVCAIDQRLPKRLCGDPGRIRQILINLLGNAIKFTESGEVVLRVSLDEGPVPETPGTVHLHCTVQDTGIGISPQQCEVIFDSFTQADGSMSRKYGGTGLGLTISSRLAKMMGGDIRVESELGHGATFHLSISLTQAEADPSQLALATTADITNLSVLIVDDNDTNRHVLATMLSPHVASIELAAGGESALEKIRASRFDLLLIDGQMPLLDGFALVERLKALSSTACIPIILFTSAGQQSAADHLQRLGVEGYLMKPVGATELLAAIRAVMRKPAEPCIDSPLRPRHQLQERTGGLRILLAEDEPINQMLVRALLAGKECQVQTVENGQQALDAIRQNTFDVILMDVSMPVMDGLETTRAIRSQEKENGQHIRIITMTAHAMPGDREACLAAGADGYLAKPISPDRLFAVLEQSALRSTEDGYGT